MMTMSEGGEIWNIKGSSIFVACKQCVPSVSGRALFNDSMEDCHIDKHPVINKINKHFCRVSSKGKRAQCFFFR